MGNGSVEEGWPRCPRCGNYIPTNEAPGAYPGALSRRDGVTEICSSCGVVEALQDWAARAGDSTP